jgi:hypothetical protein
VTTEAPGAGTEPDEDEDYLARLLLLHPEIDPDAGEPLPPAPPTAAPAPTVAAAGTVAPRVLVGAHRSGPAIAYDGDGWISVVPDDPPAPEPAPATAAPPPEPPPAVTPLGDAKPRWWRRNAAYIGVVLIIAVVVAGMALAPGGERPVLLSGSPTTVTDEPATDPLLEEWRLDDVNLQFSDVEEGYVQVFDKSVDPVGTDGCTQPTKADGVVATSRAAYAYRPDHLDGFAAGHVASMITVFHNVDAAARYAVQERRPEHLDCLAEWDETTWFGDTPIEAKSQSIIAVPAALEGRTLVGARYTATYDAPDGRSYAAYTDHIIVTTGRVRVWIELSSVLYPFDPDRRDAILDGILERLDAARS